MADIKKWFQPEITKKEIYEGIYPVVITAAKAYIPKRSNRIDIQNSFRCAVSRQNHRQNCRRTKLLF